ncbi:S41 family peptidase [Prochlorococcus sp. MIT 1300]|uniref:S41 family peptidase n=1 Tax=Prochlorococcus sp. MIT 1300 TaxID=3096218 RepID=UPI002A750F50|nr:S41 family peptidase [Prochlorococcus sp. MIT 1300]
MNLLKKPSTLKFALEIDRKFLFLSSLYFAFFISSPGFSFPRKFNSSIADSPKEVIDQVWQIVYRDYLDPTGSFDRNDWIDIRKKMLNRTYSDNTESYDAIRGMLESLKDPYTRFMEPKDFKEMQIDTSGELTGVGIQLSLDRETKELIVVSPIENTPAFEAGIQPNDVIILIDGRSTKGMSIQDAVKLIRGKEGTKVVLGIRRNGKVIKFPIYRAKIELLAVNRKINTTFDGLDVGYIRLKQFNSNAAKEMRVAIKDFELKGVEGYVLDLRSNPGGLLESSVDIARQWINRGTIVSTMTRDGIKDTRRANGRALTSRPVVVLVNEGSASASEILSGAIQDNRRGILVGQKTFGKGLVQSVRRLSDGSGLTVTIAKYLTPNGTDIHRNGIYPDIQSTIPKGKLEKMTTRDLGTEADVQYVVAETALSRLLSRQNNENSFDYHKYNLVSQF